MEKILNIEEKMELNKNSGNSLENFYDRIKNYLPNGEKKSRSFSELKTYPPKIEPFL